MESRAISRYIRQSPYKMRKTLDAIKGLDVGNAINHLHFSKTLKLNFLNVIKS